MLHASSSFSTLISFSGKRANEREKDSHFGGINMTQKDAMLISLTAIAGEPHTAYKQTERKRPFNLNEKQVTVISMGK